MGKHLEVIGAKELEKVLKGLGNRVAKRILKRALHAAAQPVLKAAKANVPQESGLLKKSLARVTSVKGTGGVAKVGARTETAGEFEGKPRVPWRYSHLVELGHITASGQHVPAKPFLRPAADSTEQASLRIMADMLADGVAKEAAKKA